MKLRKKMKGIKIFEGCDVNRLQFEILEWSKIYDHFEVIDAKFNSCTASDMDAIHYSVMFFFEYPEGGYDGE